MKKGPAGEVKEMVVTILVTTDDQIMVRDKKNIIYIFHVFHFPFDVGSYVLLAYSGVLNKNPEMQMSEIVRFISEELIDKLVFRILAWKYYKRLMLTNLKS